MTKLKNKSFGVLGLGISGISTIEFLNQHKCEFICWDDNQKTPYTSGYVPIDDDRWLGLDYLVVSPGVPFDPFPHPLITKVRHNKNTKIICDVELFYLMYPEQKFIAITGSNGKSTTTKLIEHILLHNNIKAIAAGNIGTAIVSVEPNKYDWVVVECSSYQLDLIDTFKPQVSAIINITPNHIDRHGDMQNYINAKNRIFKNQNSGDHIVLNLDNNVTKNIFDTLNSKAEKVGFSCKQKVKHGVSIIKNILTDAKGNECSVPSNDNLKGAHNLENIAAAYAIVSCCTTLHAEEICAGIASYPGLQHRLQFLGTKHGITFINDSKSTTAVSTEKALEAMEENAEVYLILGGLPKTEGIEALGAICSKIHHAFIIGEAQKTFPEHLQKHNVQYTLSGTLQEAVSDSVALAKKSKSANKVILLSPACASFDQWKNFEARGDGFIEMVALL